MTSREEFIKKIRATFAREAAEGMASITTCLIELEKEPRGAGRDRLLETAFRDAHSLKGAARAVNLTAFETICQSMEGLFSALKHQTIETGPRIFDLFHLSLNTLERLLPVADNELPEELNTLVTTLSANMMKAERGEGEPVEEIKAVITPPRSDETIRVSVAKLDGLLFRAEEMLTVKFAFDNVATGLSDLLSRMEPWKEEASERAAGKEITNGNAIPSPLRGFLGDLDKLRRFSVTESHDADTKIESLLDEVKRLLAVPVATVSDVLPKAARDLAKDKNKELTFIIQGDDIEIDRRILEEIRNPLMHLLRNCIDHGIETPVIRKQSNKPEKGTVMLAINRLENNMVEIVMSDDGAGIDLEKVKQAYIRSEKVSPEEQDGISEQRLLNYIFRSGISTSEMITDLSGRGLGLAIVREKIEQLGGSVTVTSARGKGTEFRIQIPITMVTFRGVRVLLGQQEVIIPTSSIHRVLRHGRQQVKTVNNKETIPFNGGFIPLVPLSDVLEIPSTQRDEEQLLILVLDSGEEPVGFAVDRILEEEVILVRKFNPQLKRVRNISGATVLGSGKVVPIVNVSDLVKSAAKGIQDRPRTETAGKEPAPHSILVVEDSITSRMLLKNILEAAGYNVSTAIDGMEGYTKLKEDPVDLVVSDVDMPRMNGFDLTARIRSDKAVAEIPVVLVTSLSKREDRERGMEVGANAYIVKSNFDQSNLLEVVERLL